MKKKLIVLLLCAFSFIAGMVFTTVIPASSAANDGINRSPDIIYPEDDYYWRKTVNIYIQTNDKYYHDWVDSCDFTDQENKPLEVSVYEAVERGYSPCPSCIMPEVEICTFQWNHMIKD